MLLFPLQKRSSTSVGLRQSEEISYMITLYSKPLFSRAYWYKPDRIFISVERVKTDHTLEINIIALRNEMTNRY